MKQLIKRHAHEHLSHRGIVKITNGHMEAHGIYGAAVILTCPNTIEYYHIYASGSAVGMTKTRTEKRSNADLPLFQNIME